MALAFKKATKHAAKLRLALIGVSGSGKTYSALAVASALGGRIAVIDTERGSASKYADRFAFDVLELESFGPRAYVEAIAAAQVAGYDIIVVDSLSHAWMGKDGALEQVDRATERSQSHNSYFAWRDVTPQHNALVDALVQAKAHVIVTMRAKTEYVIDTDKKGNKVPRKLGLAPIQRDGLEYEFDVVGEMTLEHKLVVSKTRCPDLATAIIDLPGAQLAGTLLGWLAGEPAPEHPAVAPAEVRAEDALAAEKFAQDMLAATSAKELAAVGARISKAHLPAEIEAKLRAVYAESAARLRDAATAPTSASETEAAQ